MITIDDHHRYFWNGKRVPGTTEICSILAPRWAVDEWYLEKGRIIDLITNYEDEGNLDQESVDPSLTGYIQAYRKFKIETNFIPVKIQYQFYSKKYGFAGRADKIGVLFNYMSVVDIKSGVPCEADRYQVPAYLFGLKDNGLRIWRAWDLYLKANGNYRLEEVKQPSIWFQKFLLGVKKWMEVNNGTGN